MWAFRVALFEALQLIIHQWTEQPLGKGEPRPKEMRAKTPLVLHSSICKLFTENERSSSSIVCRNVFLLLLWSVVTHMTLALFYVINPISLWHVWYKLELLRCSIPHTTRRTWQWSWMRRNREQGYCQQQEQTLACPRLWLRKIPNISLQLARLTAVPKILYFEPYLVWGLLMALTSRTCPRDRISCHPTIAMTIISAPFHCSAWMGFDARK